MITINRTMTIDDYLLSTPIKETIDAELDQFSFVVKRKEPIEFLKGSKVEMNGKVFMLFSYSESIDGDLYTYSVECLSPTKLLENFIIDGIAMTRKEGLYYQFVNMITKINAQLNIGGFGNTLLELDDSGLRGYILSINYGYDFLFNGQTNVREILDQMLDVVDCRITGYDFTNSYGTGSYNITKIYIGVQRNNPSSSAIITNSNTMKEALEKINDITKVYGYSKNRDAENQTGHLHTTFTSGIPNKNVITSWLPLRNDDAILDDTADWHFITQEPIYSINSFKMIVVLRTMVVAQVLQTTGQYLNVDSQRNIGWQIDISDCIVEKKIWDSMSITEQQKHLYFVRGERGIYGFLKTYKSSIIQSSTILFNVIKSKFVNLATQSSQRYYLVSNGNWVNSYKPEIDWVEAQEISTSTYNLINKNTTFHVGGDRNYSVVNAYTLNYLEDAINSSLFKLDYEPYVDGILDTRKTANHFVQNLSVNNSHDSSNVDINRLIANQTSLLNKLGEEQVYIDSISDTLLAIGRYFQVGSDKYLITQREYTPYNTTQYKIRYTFSKNYNASNSYVRMNREKRSYDIPRDTIIDRYIIVNNVDFSTFNKLLLICKNELSNTNGLAMLDLVEYGDNYAIARPIDNYGATIQKTQYSGARVNVALTYANTSKVGDFDRGELQSITLYLAKGDMLEQSTNYNYNNLPFLPNTILNNIERWDYTSIAYSNVYKDKLERLIFVFKKQ